MPTLAEICADPALQPLGLSPQPWTADLTRLLLQIGHPIARFISGESIPETVAGYDFNFATRAETVCCFTRPVAELNRTLLRGGRAGFRDAAIAVIGDMPMDWFNALETAVIAHAGAVAPPGEELLRITREELS